MEEEPIATNEKTVPLAPTVRRSIAAPIRVPGLEHVSSETEPIECAFCYGLGVIPTRGLQFWYGCPWCKDSDLHIIVCQVGERYLAVRDTPDIRAWGDNVVEALLQCEMEINESDSIWARKYFSNKDPEKLVSLPVQSLTYAILQKKAHSTGCSIEELLAKFALENTENENTGMSDSNVFTEKYASGFSQLADNQQTEIHPDYSKSRQIAR